MSDRRPPVSEARATPPALDERAPRAEGLQRVLDARAAALAAAEGLLSVEGLVSAIPDDLAYWEDAIFHGRPKADLARVILASLTSKEER